MYRVAPYAGAWIEIITINLSSIVEWSLPTRERGLKSKLALNIISSNFGRSLRGSVD